MGDRVDPSIPQGRVTFLSGNLGGTGSDGGGREDGYDADYGIGGDANIHNRGRFIGVALKRASASLRSLPFRDPSMSEGVERRE